MEYLASGKQVIMHGLPCIPSEYLEHLTVPATSDALGLAQALHKIAVMSLEERAVRGARARTFILASKSPEAQVARVLVKWAELRNGKPARGTSVRQT